MTKRNCMTFNEIEIKHSTSLGSTMPSLVKNDKKAKKINET